MQRAKPLPTELPEKVARHFWAKIERKGPDQCWPWLGYKTPKGYGRYNIRSIGGVAPHRLAYSITVGAVPTDKVIDHLCRNRACCNPQHLEPVSNYENIKRGTDLITHCKKGHPLSGDNLYAPSVKCRKCATCKKENARLWWINRGRFLRAQKKLNEQPGGEGGHA